MKKEVSLFLIVCVLSFVSGCGERTNRILSPSKKWTVDAVVNQDRSDPKKFLCLQLVIAQPNGVVTSLLQTGASDRMKWALGWMEPEDIVVFFSSDIGTHAYSVDSSGALSEIEATPSIKERAKTLYNKKY